MPTATAKRNKPDTHPDQLETLVSAKAMPCRVEPRNPKLRGKELLADVRQCQAELRQVATELRDAQNEMVAEWLGYHHIAGTAARVRRWEPGVEGLPADLFLAMYHAAKPIAKTVASDVLTCALNWLVSTIRTQNSPRANMRRWRSVLMANRERPWYWADPQPIRLSPKSASVEIVGSECYVVLKVVKGKPPIRLLIKGETATNRELRPNGPGANGQKYNERLRILRTTLAVNGAILTETRGKWFFTFLERKAAPRLPVKEDLKTMFVRSSYRAGFRVRWAGERAFLIDRDQLRALGAVRREQMARRAEMKLARLDSRTKEGQLVKHRWENYCRTLCQQSVSELLDLVESAGIERIAVMAGDEWCALSSVGNEERDQHEPTRFPFALFATILKQKAMERGIVVVSRPNLRSVKRRKELWRKQLERKG